MSEIKNCSNCAYCEFIGFDKNDIENIAIYECTNKASKKYGKILDRFTVDRNVCNEHHFDPELTA